MPYIETPSDLADALADDFGIYGYDERCDPEGEHAHVEGCKCRSWWVVRMTERIRQSVENESQLHPIKAKAREER